MKREIHPGLRFDWTRTVTADDIRRFAELSEDRGAHHLEPGPDGRLLAHGLLTATLPTKLGGDLDFVARTMRFDFLAPVYSGDTLTCFGVVDTVLPKPGRVKVSFSFEVKNQDGKLVMKGMSAGAVYEKGFAASPPAKKRV